MSSWSGGIAALVAMRRAEQTIASACALTTALVLMSISGAQRPSEAAIRTAIAAFPYSMLLIHRLSEEPRIATQLAILLAAVTGLVLVGTPPLLSDDLYRYLWDARVLRSGIDPYAYAPTDPALAPLRDELFARINHADIPTIYPPVAQMVFGVANAFGHAPWSIQLVALLAHLITGVLVCELAGSRFPRAGPLYALNPLALEEAALGGHVDAFVALFLALSALTLIRRRPIASALALAASTGTKLIGIALLPGLAHRRYAFALAVVLSGVFLAPLLPAGYGSESAGGLTHYAARWRGNEGGFALVSHLTQLSVDAAGRWSGSQAGRIDLSPLTRLVDNNLGTGWSTKDPSSGPKKRLNISSGYSTWLVSQRLSRAIVAALVLGVAITQRRWKTHSLIASRNVVLCALLLAPQIHPWYLVWLLPLDLACGGIVALTWSVIALAAYSPLDSWAMSRIWNDLAWIRPVEYALVVSAALATYFILPFEPRKT